MQAGNIDMLLLTPAERRLLAALIEAKPAVVAFRAKGTAKVHVHRIREKLGVDGKGLVTVWGHGYRWLG